MKLRFIAPILVAIAVGGCTAGGPSTAKPVLAGDPVPVLDTSGLGTDCAALAGELVTIADEFPYRELVDVDASMEVDRIVAAAPRVCGEADANRLAAGVLGPWSVAVPPTFDPAAQVDFGTSCDTHLADARAALAAFGATERFDQDAETAYADALNAIPFAVDPVEFIVAGEPVPDEVAAHTDDGCTATEIDVFRAHEELPVRRLAGVLPYNLAGDVAGNRVEPQTERVAVPSPGEPEVFEVDGCEVELDQLNERVADLSADGADRVTVDAAVDALVDAEVRCGLRDS